MAGVGSGADAGGSARVGMGVVTRSDAVEVVEGHGGGGGGTAALATLADAALGEVEMVDAEVSEAERLDLNVAVGIVEDLAPVQPQVVAPMQAPNPGAGYDVLSPVPDEEYFSGSGSDNDVEQWTYKSFVKKEEKKLGLQGISAYLPFTTEFYRCPFHHFKPRGGLRMGLVQHVHEVATRGRLGEDYFQGDLRDRGRHEGLLRVLEPDEFIFSDSETKEE